VIRNVDRKSKDELNHCALGMFVFFEFWSPVLVLNETYFIVEISDMGLTNNTSSGACQKRRRR